MTDDGYDGDDYEYEYDDDDDDNDDDDDDNSGFPPRMGLKIVNTASVNWELPTKASG